MANNYKVKMVDLQNKYKFKIFCSSQIYDDTDLKREVEAIYKAFPKASATGTSATLTGTAAAIMNIDLKGNTSQVSYTGRNLYNFNDTANISTGITIDNEGWITCTYDNTSGSSNMIKNCMMANSQLLEANTTYSVFLEVASISGTGTIKISESASQAQSNTNLGFDFVNLQSNQIYLGTIETKSDFTGCSRLLQQYFYFRTGQNGSIKCRLSLIKGTSLTPSTFTYEPYVGGTAAPSPSYPQNVNVVSGDNTITIANSDDTESQSYNVNLGTLELCKIGDYQDYIYKEGKKWYKYGAIGKKVLTGGAGESWQVANTGTPNYIYLTYLVNFKPITTGGYSNYYPYIAIGGSDTNQGIFAVTDYVRIRWGTEDTLANFKTWLSTHNVILYWIKTTPTNEEITDTTLISQLNALRNAESYEGQTNISQTNSKEAFIITASAIKDLSNL